MPLTVRDEGDDSRGRAVWAIYYVSLEEEECQTISYGCPLPW